MKNFEVEARVRTKMKCIGGTDGKNRRLCGERMKKCKSMAGVKKLIMWQVNELKNEKPNFNIMQTSTGVETLF